MSIKLTEYSKGSGCGCKIDSALLSQIIGDINIGLNSPVKVGLNEDASILKIADDLFLISSTDFFTPIVNNPLDFGSIAAANALSDIYAMGATPSMALSILGWPLSKISIDHAKTVLKGAENVCARANINIMGGHSIETSEPIFGLVVNGFATASQLKLNSGAKPGDLIYLTKPIGSGILASALKRDLLDNDLNFHLVMNLISLNSFGSIAGNMEGVTAMTDVTGFGLIGHLNEVCYNSGVGAVINYNSIKFLKGVEDFMKQLIYPEITTRNFNNYKDCFFGFKDLDLLTLCDPQTSGGLLIFLNPAYQAEFEKAMIEKGLNAFTTPIGYVNSDPLQRIEIIYS
jgi:selenide,water dikinase